MLPDAIKLIEAVDKHAKINIDSSIDSTDYYLEYSQLVALNGSSLHTELMNKINRQCLTDQPDWTNIKFISLVFLTCDESNLEETLIRVYVEELPPLGSDNSTFGDCMVVSIDADAGDFTLIHKPRRTSGKVSNKLG